MSALPFSEASRDQKMSQSISADLQSYCTLVKEEKQRQLDVSATKQLSSITDPVADQSSKQNVYM